MKHTKRKPGVAVSAAVILSAAAILFAVFGSADKKTVYMTACWAYNYESVEQLAANSDLIALVRVAGAEDTAVDGGIPYTTFKVQVITPVYHSAPGEEFLIYMTGGETKHIIYEVTDDPLLQAGDEILVFCRENADGTYQILSGAQGRLVYADGTLSSLNVLQSDTDESNSYSGITVDRADADAFIENIKKLVET